MFRGCETVQTINKISSKTSPGSTLGTCTSCVRYGKKHSTGPPTLARPSMRDTMDNSLLEQQISRVFTVPGTCTNPPPTPLFWHKSDYLRWHNSIRLTRRQTYANQDKNRKNCSLQPKIKGIFIVNGKHQNPSFLSGHSFVLCFSTLL